MKLQMESEKNSDLSKSLLFQNLWKISLTAGILAPPPSHTHTRTHTYMPRLRSGDISTSH